MGKIVCENEKLIFDKLSTNVSDYCMTEKEGFKKPECQRIEVETDGKNEQHVGVLKLLLITFSKELLLWLKA